jgi:hypothetical protein
MQPANVVTMAFAALFLPTLPPELLAGARLRHGGVLHDVRCGKKPTRAAQ